MRAKKMKASVVSHDDIQKALRKFQANGGLIQKLPPQVVIRHSLVGGKWGMFESISEGGETAPTGSEGLNN
ncbi:MAG: hypothetical protein OEV94_08215 [Deltaproteobacteria bacterium]|nr:hypothetical protein [Deltaproteobacteria bacterium]